MSYVKTEKDKERNRERKREWYLENAKLQQARIKARQVVIRKWFQALKSTLKCIQCGENHPACLDFHHRNPVEKEANLSHAWLKGWSKERILKEMDKCDVLCSNCHRKLHAADIDLGPDGKASL